MLFITSAAANVSQEIDKLREKWAEMQATEDQEVRRIDELSRMNAAYEECVKDLEDQHSAHQTQYTQLKKLVEEKKARTNTLREKLRIESRKEDDIATSLRKCYSTRESLESDMACARKTIDAMELELASLRAKAATMTAEFETEKARTGFVEEKLREARTKRTILNAELWQTVQDLRAHELSVKRFVSASTKNIVRDSLHCFAV